MLSVKKIVPAVYVYKVAKHFNVLLHEQSSSLQYYFFTKLQRTETQTKVFSNFLFSNYL